MCREYTCAVCGGRFVKGWSDEEAAAEYAQNMPAASARGDEEELVCDDCYKEFMVWAKQEGIEL